MHTVVVLFGGPSLEYEVSLCTAARLLGEAAHAPWEVLAVGVTRDGTWLACPADPERIRRDEWACERRSCRAVTPVRGGLALVDGGEVLRPRAIWPAVHGAWGEDGTLQGLLTALGLPYVGCGVTASALCMHKALTKARLRDCGLPVADWVEVERGALECPDETLSLLHRRFPGPVFVKPAVGGSSLGARPAPTEADRLPALRGALHHAPTALVEPLIAGVECEVAVWESAGALTVSRPGQILCAAPFFDYGAKYTDPATAAAIPARISDRAAARMRELAEGAFRVLGCRQMARVDFFLPHGAEEPLINEINTLPGMTERSLFPALLADAGLPFSELLVRGVEEAAC